MVSLLLLHQGTFCHVPRDLAGRQAVASAARGGDRVVSRALDAGAASAPAAREGRPRLPLLAPRPSRLVTQEGYGDGFA